MVAGAGFEPATLKKIFPTIKRPIGASAASADETEAECKFAL